MILNFFGGEGAGVLVVAVPNHDQALGNTLNQDLLPIRRIFLRRKNKSLSNDISNSTLTSLLITGEGQS